MEAGAAWAPRRSRSGQLFRRLSTSKCLERRTTSVYRREQSAGSAALQRRAGEVLPRGYLELPTFDDPRGGFRLVRGDEVRALSGPVHDLRAGDDGRQYRARDQLLGGVPEIPLACAGRIRRAIALAAVPAVFGRRRLTGRPVRSASHHP